MTTPWPPLIAAANVSFWARLRDIVLTVAAWLLLAYLLMPMIRALWSDMQVVLGLSPPGAIPALERLWQDLAPFLGLVALMMLWMVCYAGVRRLVLTRSLRAAGQSPPLDRATHVQSLGLSPKEAGKLQQARVAVVEFDAASRIAIVRMPDPGQGQTPRLPGDLPELRRPTS